MKDAVVTVSLRAVRAEDPSTADRKRRAERIDALVPDRSAHRDPMLEQLSDRVGLDDDAEYRIARKREQKDVTQLQALRGILAKANRPTWSARVRAWWRRTWRRRPQ